MSGDMPKVWWSPEGGHWLSARPKGGFYELHPDEYNAVYDVNRLDGAVELKRVSDAPPAPVETEWAAIHEDGTVIDCVDQDEARYYRDNPRHSHRDGYRAVCRAVIRSEWQEVTDDV